MKLPRFLHFRVIVPLFGLPFLIAVLCACNYKAPKVEETPEFSQLSDTSVRLGGNGIDGGEGGGSSSNCPLPISSRGFYYSVFSENPDPKEGGAMVTEVTEGGGGNGEFFSDVTGLDPNTKYAFRAWVASSRGSDVSHILTFTTYPLGESAPLVSSPSAADVSSSGATLGGDVLAAGGDSITEIGIVYSLTSDNEKPLIGGDGVTKVVASGTALGVFTQSVSSLAQDSEYAVVAYATNSFGTGYSDVKAFMTNGLPEVGAKIASDIDATSATLGGGVISEGGGGLTEFGVVYSVMSVNGAPELGGAGVVVSKGLENPESFDLEVAELDPNTAYSFKAFATNSEGTSYSELRSFKTDATSRSADLQRFRSALASQTARNGTTPASNVAVEGNVISVIASQPDGKTIVGGSFVKLGGESHNSLARIKADGTVDSDFVAAPEVAASGSGALAVQKDGKILVGNDPLLRLHPDGSLDTGFANVEFDSGGVQALAVQPDGKILVGGHFLEMNGEAREWLVRLNSDGTIDDSFVRMGYDPSLGAARGVDATVKVIALQPDGKILISGQFTRYTNISGGMVTEVDRRGVARLHPDGSLDTSFDPGPSDAYYPNIILQPDGKILVSGDFTNFNGTTRSRVARLESNGDLDPTFDPGVGPDAHVKTMVLQADGKILIGGDFANVSGSARAGVARLNADGTHDTSVDPGSGFGEGIEAILLREDGTIVIAGGSYLGPTPPYAPRNLIQFVGNDLAAQFIATTATSVEWLRFGSVPEVSGVTFELATSEGLVSLGKGTRIVDGWELTGITVPAEGIIRARGWTSSNGQYGGGSVGLVEYLRQLEAEPVALPDLTSPTATGVGATEAMLGGTLVSAGGAPITERGIVYAPTSEDGGQLTRNVIRVAEGGTGTGAFAVAVSDLVSGKDYSYAAYATSSAGAAYSDIGSFTTLGPAEVTSPTSDSVTESSATLGGNVVSDGGEAITERGVIYSPFSAVDGGAERLFTNQATLENAPKMTAPGTTGVFTTNVSGLDEDTEYVFAAYATNAQGTVYSDPNRFTTSQAPPAPEGDGQETGGTAGPGPIFLSGGTAPDEGAAASGLSAGALDEDYDPGVLREQAVMAIALLPSGEAIIAGEIRRVGGFDRDCIAKLGQGGSVDPFFYPHPNSTVHSVAVQPDGKLLIGGQFTKVSETSRNGIARLNEDGTLENESTFNVGAGADGVVYSVALQPDGKILIGGLFSSVQGYARPGIARLKANGQVDTTFDPGDGANDAVYSIAVQPDGKILVGGHFTDFDGTSVNRIVRLETNGSVDGTFDPGTGADDRVTGVSVQPNGDILTCGYFTTMDGTSRSRIARLLPSGLLDTTFDPGTGADGHIYSIASQLDGKILIGGLFQNFDGTARNRIARLTETGALDTSFDPGEGANNEVDAVVIEEDGSILIGGTFTEVDGESRGGMARYGNDGATESLTVVDGTRMQWHRGGATSVVSEVGFEVSEDGGASWEMLGAGSEIAGGWELSGQALPRNGIVRALGCTTGGFLSGSSGVAGEEMAFDHNGKVSSLTAQIRVAKSKTKRTKKQLKKAKKKKNKRKIKSLKKKLKKLKLQQRRATVSLRLYP